MQIVQVMQKSNFKKVSQKCQVVRRKNFTCSKKVESPLCSQKKPTKRQNHSSKAHLPTHTSVPQQQFKENPFSSRKNFQQLYELDKLNSKASNGLPFALLANNTPFEKAVSKGSQQKIDKNKGQLQSLNNRKQEHEESFCEKNEESIVNILDYKLNKILETKRKSISQRVPGPITYPIKTANQVSKLEEERKYYRKVYNLDYMHHENYFQKTANSVLNKKIEKKLFKQDFLGKQHLKDQKETRSTFSKATQRHKESELSGGDSYISRQKSSQSFNIRKHPHPTSNVTNLASVKKYRKNKFQLQQNTFKNLEKEYVIFNNVNISTPKRNKVVQYQMARTNPAQKTEMPQNKTPLHKTSKAMKCIRKKPKIEKTLAQQNHFQLINIPLRTQIEKRIQNQNQRYPNSQNNNFQTRKRASSEMPVLMKNFLEEQSQIQTERKISEEQRQQQSKIQEEMPSLKTISEKRNQETLKSSNLKESQDANKKSTGRSKQRQQNFENSLNFNIDVCQSAYFPSEKKIPTNQNDNKLQQSQVKNIDAKKMIKKKKKTNNTERGRVNSIKSIKNYYLSGGGRHFSQVQKERSRQEENNKHLSTLEKQFLKNQKGQGSKEKSVKKKQKELGCKTHKINWGNSKKQVSQRNFSRNKQESGEIFLKNHQINTEENRQTQEKISMDNVSNSKNFVNLRVPPSSRNKKQVRFYFQEGQEPEVSFQNNIKTDEKKKSQKSFLASKQTLPLQEGTFAIGSKSLIAFEDPGFSVIMAKNLSVSPISRHNPKNDKELLISAQKLIFQNNECVEEPPLGSLQELYYELKSFKSIKDTKIIEKTPQQP